MRQRNRRGKGEYRYVIPFPPALKQTREGEHWTSAGRATQTGYGFCEGCQSTQPRNGQPNRKGWRCDNCRSSKQCVSG